MKTILVPLGNSEKAIGTLQYAIDFATVTGAKIYVIQVYGLTNATYTIKNMDTILEKDSKDELALILSQVNTKGIEVISKSIKGKITDRIEDIAKKLKIDLIIASANNSSADSSIYLGPITGKLVKRTELPMLIIPKDYIFKPIKTILLGLKSGLLNHQNVLSPLQNFVKTFEAKVTLLHVITPKNTEADNGLHEEFKAIANKVINTENATIYQGILEHLNAIKPDMLCAIRRKRGVFSKLWEKNTIKKEDFESRIPLLVLKGNV